MAIDKKVSDPFEYLYMEYDTIKKKLQSYRMPTEHLESTAGRNSTMKTEREINILT